MLMAHEVFTVYAFLMLIAASMGLVLFRGQATEAYPSGQGFENFRDSLITMFVFISTGENFQQLIYGVTSVHPAYCK